MLMSGFCTGTAGGYFPKQLSKEDEEKYVRLWKNGDTAARNILIEHNLRLVAHIAKKYAATGLSAEDLISIGSIGLIKAVSTFDPDKGSRLGTYAVRCIENEILMYLRTDKKHQNDVFLQDTVGQDSEGNEITLMDLLSSDDDTLVEDLDMRMRVKYLHQKVADVLKGRERTIIELRYGMKNGVEKTQKEIGKMLGISRSYVSRIEKSALKKLRAAMR